jgi:hypothetical protein
MCLARRQVLVKGALRTKPAAEISNQRAVGRVAQAAPGRSKLIDDEAVGPNLVEQRAHL